MRKESSIIFMLVSATGLALLAGCATEPSLMHDTYGDAVRNMVDAQIYDRAAAANPGDEPVSLYGKKGEAVLKMHREAVPKAADMREFDQPIVIQPAGQ